MISTLIKTDEEIYGSADTASKDLKWLVLRVAHWIVDFIIRLSVSPDHLSLFFIISVYKSDVRLFSHLQRKVNSFCEAVSNLDKRIGAFEPFAEKFQSQDARIDTIKRNVKDIDYSLRTIAKVDNKGRGTNKLAYETRSKVHAQHLRMYTYEKKHLELEGRVTEQEKCLANFIETGSTTGSRGFAKIKFDRPSFFRGRLR